MDLKEIPSVDGMIKEYLLFRGFLNTLKTFEGEKKHDKYGGFDSTKIVEKIFSYLKKFEYSSYLEFWKYLKETLFPSIISINKNNKKKVHEMEKNLTKFYLINIILKNKHEKLITFFKEYGTSLFQNKILTKDWFILPFIKKNNELKFLEPYFNEQWIEILTVSLQNFIETCLLIIKKPKLLNLEINSKIEKINLKNNLKSLLKMNKTLNIKIKELENYIYKLEKLNNLPLTITAKQQPDISRMKTSPNGTINVKTNSNTSTNSPSNKKRKGKNLFPNSNVLNEYEKTSKKGGFKTKRTKANVSNVTGKNIFVSKIFSGHKDFITDLKFNDGELMATSSLDCTLKIWNISKNKCEKSYSFDSQILSFCWVSKDNIVTGFNDGSIQLGLENNNTQVVLKEYPFINSVKTHDGIKGKGNLFINGYNPINNRGKLVLYNIKKNKIVHNYSIDNLIVNSIAFNGSQKLFAASLSDGTIRIFDANNNKEIMKWNAHDNHNVTDVKFLSNDSTMLSTAEDNTVIEWDLYLSGYVKNKIKIDNQFGKSIGDDDSYNYKQKLAVADGRFLLNSPSLIFSTESFKISNYLLNLNNKILQMRSIDWNEKEGVIAGAEREIFIFES